MQIDKTKPIMLTGATGYVAGWLVKKLLEEGLTVHAAVRDPKNKEKLKYLNQIAEKSSGTIKYFKADLLAKDSYLEAMKGCELVYHTASPFSLNIEDAQKDLIDPALKGTKNVLDSVNKTDTVKRVVLTSSVAAIFGDNKDIESLPNKTLTEEHWNTSSSLTHQPYSYSKKLAEEEAWKISKEQSRWDLVVINPSLVIGPGINPFGTSESFNLVKQIGDGTMRAGAPGLIVGGVDVRDLADAHYNAGFFPDAEGRHIISNKAVSFVSLAKILREKYGNSYPFPKKEIPKFLIWLMAPLVGFERKMVARNIGYAWNADNSKSIQKLGVRYRPIEESIIDFFQQMIDNDVFKKNK